MARGKHKHTKTYADKRNRWTSKHPRGDKKGGGKTRLKRNVKQAGAKRRLGERWKP